MSQPSAVISPVRAPEFPDSLDWVNVGVAPSIASNHGKVVLIYFWSYANLQSLNLLPAIRDIENKYESGVFIVGIHCPKFASEHSSKNVLKAVNRLFLRHPVACDNQFALWKEFGIQAWPSAVLVDAEGKARFLLQGDNIGSQIDDLADDLLNEAAQKDIRNYGRVRNVRKPEPKTTLKFPMGITYGRGSLYIADSANNRILELNESGRLLRTFGSGNPGFWDGSMQNSGFSWPQGMVVSENYLFVADAGNHALRRINLFSGEIETTTGTGKPNITLVSGVHDYRQIPMHTPVALALDGPVLYIAMAGAQQIWRLDLKNSEYGWFAGSGQSGVRDGDAKNAAFGFPHGLAVAGKELLVSDAEGSAIRTINIESQKVQTRLGRGYFTFGLEDGASNKSLLQYPSAICVSGDSGVAWILDSFNGKVRRLDLKNGELSTPDFDIELHEPRAMCVHGQNLWIADTNAHRIVKIDTNSRKAQVLEVASGRL